MVEGKSHTCPADPAHLGEKCRRREVLGVRGPCVGQSGGLGGTPWRGWVGAAERWCLAAGQTLRQPLRPGPACSYLPPGPWQTRQICAPATTRGRAIPAKTGQPPRNGVRCGTGRRSPPLTRQCRARSRHHAALAATAGKKHGNGSGPAAAAINEGVAKKGPGDEKSPWQGALSLRGASRCRSLRPVGDARAG